MDKKIVEHFKKFCEEASGEFEMKSENIVACKLPPDEKLYVEFSKGKIMVSAGGSELNINTKKWVPLKLDLGVNEGYTSGSIDLSNIPNVTPHGKLNLYGIKEVAILKGGDYYTVHIG